MTIKQKSVDNGDIEFRDNATQKALLTLKGTARDIEFFDGKLIVTDEGRISSSSEAGAANTIPDDYTYGEVIELRFTFAETGNNQRQGIFMDVRTNVDNSGTIRTFEMMAQSEGDIDVGTLSGGSMKAIPRGESGTIDNLFGGEAEVTFNDSDWAGTVTQLAGHRTKVSLEDGGTYTDSSVYLAEVEAITGGETIGSYYRAKNNSGITADALIDATGCPLTVVDTDKVNLIKFRDAGGDEVILRVADGGTVSVAAA